MKLVINIKRETFLVMREGFLLTMITKKQFLCNLWSLSYHTESKFYKGKKGKIFGPIIIFSFTFFIKLVRF